MLSAVSVAADAADEPTVSACFSVQARAEPGVMPRALELFAKRGLVPQLWLGAVTGPQSAETLTIEIRIAGVARDTVDYIARCLRQIVGVDTVLTASD
jgi:acetolactate synthase small subunit